MGKPKAPEPPDPRETAAASTSTNIGTAIANASLNQVNQITPDGSLRYSQTGSTTWTDPYTGQVYQIPQYTATQTLSKAQQAIKDQTDAAQLNLGTLANNQSAFLNDYMAKPINLNNEEVEARLFSLGRQRLDPLLDQQRESLATRLAGQGIKLGSTAYDRAMTQFDQGRNDAYNSLLLQGRGQAVQEALTERNQPINEITALLSGSQVSQPNFVNTPTSTIPTTDVAGIINNNYAQQNAAYQQNMANRNAALGGLFGVGAAFAGNPSLIKSDRRAKTDIERVGETDDGQPIYSYRYKAGGPMQLGLMAQDVEKRDPDAVTTIGGVKHVDYSKALSLGRGL